MMNEMILIVFSSRGTLTRALDHLSASGAIEFQRAAIVARAQSGEVVTLDDKIGPDEGGITGGTLGAALAAFGVAQLGALALPGIGAVIALGSAALAGAFIGGLTGRAAANLLDSADTEALGARLADRLEAGHPALILSVKDGREALDALRVELEPFRPELVERLRGD